MNSEQVIVDQKMRDIDILLSETKRKLLLVVFPHPDDESVMTGGLLQRALHSNWRVVVVSLTKGEGGKIFVHGNGRSAEEIREEEFRKALANLGVIEYYLWNNRDGYLRFETDWRNNLRSFIQELQPGVVITYDPSGITGHPDHIALSLEILSIIYQTKCSRLLWSVFSNERKNGWLNPKVKRFLQTPDWFLSMKMSEAIRKWQAMRIYRSQRLEMAYELPIWLEMQLERKEYFAEADLNKRYKYKYINYRF